MAATTNTTLGECRAVNDPSRRHLLGGSALAALSGAAFAGAIVLPARGEVAESLDAELLAACVAFDGLERAYQQTDFTCLCGTPEDLASDAERSRISSAQLPLVNLMGELQACTRDGQVARARSLALWKPEMLDDSPGDFAEVLMAAIVRDLMAEG